MFYHFLIFVCVFQLISGQDDGPIVETSYGPVQGRSVYVDTYDVTVNSFHGIYYARAPINELRFAAPEPPEIWTEVRDATRSGPACIQNGALTIPGWDYYSENCLHLDVVTPSDTSGDPYPVMVWIHGGGFRGGANVQFIGHFLASKEVVVVIINYRLGNLGFLYSGDSAIPGNAGMLDQVMALQWVQDNIANFGGDPDLVTIFGNSAGGASVGLHVVSPLSSGLFSAAILQSGTELNPWANNHPALTEQQNYTFEVAKRLDCPFDDTDAMVECLREVDARRLFNTYPLCDGFFCPSDSPVIDGPGGFLPDTPFNLRNSGHYNKVPEIVLYLSEDGSFFAWIASLRPQMPGNITAGYTREEFLQIIDIIVENETPGLSEELQDEVRAALNFMYTPWPYINNRELNREQIAYLFTDFKFGFGADAQSKTQSLENTVYQMVYGYATESIDDPFPEHLGAFHGLEVFPVFGFPYLEFNSEVQNDTGMISEADDYNDLDREYAEFMMTMWTNFAKVQNPTPDPVKPPMDWPEVMWEPITEDINNYIWLDNSAVEMKRDYRQKEYAFWSEYMRCKVFGDQAHIPGFTSCESPLNMAKF